ncbi:MAG: hypothetical protein ABIJ09_17305 [Pseudomonadota bacterium]
MSDGYKGSTIVYLREQVRIQGEVLEKSLLEGLDAELRALYLETISMSWIDVGLTARLFERAVPLLLSQVADPQQEFGRRQARDQLSGIYRILLRVVSVPMVIQQTARLWSTYHNRGQARALREGDSNRGQLIVEGYPTLPEIIRHNTTGYIVGTLELTSARSIEVQEKFDDPRSWMWNVRWG